MIRKNKIFDTAINDVLVHVGENDGICRRRGPQAELVDLRIKENPQDLTVGAKICICMLRNSNEGAWILGEAAWLGL